MPRSTSLTATTAGAVVCSLDIQQEKSPQSEPKLALEQVFRSENEMFSSNMQIKFS